MELGDEELGERTGSGRNEDEDGEDVRKVLFLVD